jgi:hypothetical protein
MRRPTAASTAALKSVAGAIAVLLAVMLSKGLLVFKLKYSVYESWKLLVAEGPGVGPA